MERLERRDLPAQAVLGSLLLDGSSLALNGSTYSASGPVEIGYNPTGSESYVPLTVWNGNMSFTSGGDSFSFSGEIDGIESSSNVTIAQLTSVQTFLVSSLTGAGQGISGGSSINVMSAEFTPNLIALVDPAGGDTTNSYVSLQGSIGFAQLPGLSAPVSGTNSVQMSPSTTAPGITLVAAASASNFTAFGLNVGPASMSVGYSTSASQFQISGSVGVVTSSGDFSVAGSLGVPDSPGLLIASNGSVTQLSLTISSNISTYGLNINANSLLLNYDPAAGDQYSIISGGISAVTNAGDFSFEGTFGCGTQPGVVINNGSLTSLYATLNGNTVASGLTMTASNDVLQFNAACGATPAEYQILSGSISIGSNTTDVNFCGTFGSGANPGVVLQGGSLTAFDITVTSNMNVSGLNLTANGVEFTYNSTGSQFEIVSGSVSVVTSDVNFLGTFGTANTPGLVMSGSTLASMDITVTSNMNVSGLNLTANGVEFIYNSTGNQFEIVSGSVSVVTSDVNFLGTFGTANTPGLVMSGSTLASMDITVTSNMNVSGLNLTANGVEFTYNSTGNQFEIVSGSVSVVTSDVNFLGTFGTANTPGLVMSGSTLASMDITVTSNMNVSGLNLTANGVEFTYNSTGNQFEIVSGSVSVVTSDVNFLGTFGTANTPGLVMSGSTLASMDITVTSNMNVSGLNLTANGVEFTYNSTGSQFEIVTGSVSVVTSDVNFLGTFGTANTPGLVMSGSTLASMDITVTSNMNVSGLNLTANGVEFTYNSTGSQFEIVSGSVSVVTSDVNFLGTFGTANTPGLVMSGSTLASLDITVTSNMNVSGLNLTANGVEFTYNSTGNQFEIVSGSVSVVTSDVNFLGTFGTANTPGLVMSGSTLASMDITVTSNMNVSGLNLTANGVEFIYNSTGSQFEIVSGSVSVVTSDVNFLGTFGTANTPGLVMSGSTLASMDITVTSNMNVSGLNLTANGVEFIYNSTGSQFEIVSGSVSVVTSDVNFLGTFGTANTPGLVMSGSTLASMDITVTSNMNVSGLNLTANGVEFIYNSTGSQFEIVSGSVSVVTSDVNFLGTFGTANTPGLVMSGSTLASMDITVTSNMNVSGLNLTANGVEFIYNSTGSQFEIVSGSVSVVTSDVNFLGTFGTANTPGLVMSGSTLASMDITVTSNMNVSGLNLTANGVEFIYNSTGSQFEIVSGSVSVVTSDVNFLGTFGTANTPGLVMSGSTLASMDITVTSNMNVSGLNLTANGVEFIYNSTGSQFEIVSGSVSVVTSDVNFLGTFGTANTPGLVMSGSTLASMDITVTSNMNVSGLNLTANGVEFTYNSTGSQFEIVSGSVSVVTSDVNFLGTFGTANTPGLVMSGSTLASMDITVTSNMNVSGLNLTANGVEFIYNSTGSQFEIVSGSVSVVTSDVNFLGTFGTANTPGLVMSGSTLASMDITVTSNMNVSGLNLTANGVEFTYNSTGSQFEIVSGSVSVVTSDVNFLGTFGTANTPGLVMSGSTLASMDITVTSNMNVSGLNLTANGVEFTYNANGSIFEIATGAVSVSGSGFSFDGIFGSGTGANATAGLSMTGSNLTGLDVTVSSLINLDGMTLSVDNLQFIYENDANSIYNGDFLINTGNVTIATSANDTYFSAEFGCATDSIPGLVIHNGSLASLYTTVSSTISAQNIVLNAASLVFQYEGSTQTFEIASGNVSISSGDIQFANAKFSVSANPGLVIDKGSLTALNIVISSNMNVMGMSLDISSMNFIYYAVSGQTNGNFEIAAGGSISLSAGSSNNPLSFSGIFGNTTSSSPGLVVNNGNLQSFYIGITSNISAGGLTINTSDLTFTYQLATNTFEIPNGSISVTATDFNFNGTFGSTLSNGTTVPGLVVSNGLLSELNTTVTSKLVAGGLTFSLDNLNFYYNSSGNQYEIDSGNISFATNEGFSFSADFGLPNPANTASTLPGLVISNGVFTEFNAALYASFTIAGLQIDVNDMAMSYNSNQYEMYGTVTVNTSAVQFTGVIGTPTASPPGYGLLIQNGNLDQCNITINSDVTFGDLTMKAQNLTFNYSSAPEEEFSLYGNVSISVDGVNLTGLLGNSTLPGLTLVNGQLNELNLGVTTDFTLFGLNCNVTDLTFIYESSSSTYIMYGDLYVSIADGASTQKIDANLGTESDPGMTIVGSTVTEINMALTADFTVDGFGFDVVDAGITYQASDNTYQIYGTFTLSDVFSASVQLGTSANPGITVSNSVFIVNQIAISLDNVPIGAFTLNYVDISYDSTGDEWQGAAAVTFPTGWEIGAAMTFINGNLDDISLFYSAGKSEGIAIPDTGIFVTYISASLQNLDEPASIIVSGSIVGDFGGQISIGGMTCRIFTAMGSFSADAQQLSISGSYYLGAYQTNNSNPLSGWTGILGSGSASVDLNWSAGTYTADMSCSLYGGIFVIDAEMAFNDEGDLGLIATATVEVPSSVPFIGGDKLGSISFAFIYTASSNSGIVAAWTTVDCIVNITTGFQYAFSSGSSGEFSLIGSGGVNDIEQDFQSITSADASVPTTYIYSYTVTIPSGSGSNGVSVIASWPSNSGNQTFGVSLPSNSSSYYFPCSTASTVPSNVDFLTSYTTPTSQSIMVAGSASNVSVLLPPGTYTFQVQSTYQFASTSCVTFTNQLYYESPNISICSVPSKALAFTPNLTGYAAGALASNATITIYTDTDNSGYNGKSAGTFAYSVSNTTSGGTLLSVPSIDLSSYAPGVPIYIYAIINDGTNTPVNSTYSTAIVPVPNVVGQILDQFGNPISGIRVFLDLNNNQNYDAPVYASNGTLTTPGEPSQITNVAGSYFFNNLEIYNGSNATAGVDIGYPNFRVMAQMPSPSFTPISPSNATIAITLNDTSTSANSPTESTVANFTINRLASITGSLYSDLIQNGVYISTDPALSYGTVYLDTNGNNQYDSSDLICVTGPSGQYGFYDLTPANYTTGIVTSTTNGNLTTNNYVVTQPSCGTYSIPIVSDAQQLGNFTFTGPYTFGVISLATFSGTVNNQTSSTSIATPLPGAIINISTPNLTACIPNYACFTSAINLNLVGTAALSNGALSLLTSSKSASQSAAWFKQSVPLTGGFESSFTWSLETANTTSGGMAFVLQNSGNSAIGNSTFGYGGLTNSLGVIFDAVNNQILVEESGNITSSAAIAKLTSQQLGFNLANGTQNTARITFLPINSNGLGKLSVYLSGDSSGGATPALTTTVNLTTVLNLGSGTNAIAGFTAGTPGSGLTSSVNSWSLTALNSQTTTTDTSGNYNFTGLMPLANYTITQVEPANFTQASPLNSLGLYSESSLTAISKTASSVATGDFNGDGKPDVAYAISLASGSPFQIAYAYGNGNGGFGAPVVANLPLTLTPPALATPSSGSVAFDAQIVAGTFDNGSRDQIAYIATMAKGGHVIVVYDIYTNTLLNEIEIELNGVTPTSNQNVVAGNLGTINNIAVDDLNNDGYDDLAVSTYGGVYTAVSLQNIVTGTSWTVNPTTAASVLSKPAVSSSSSAVSFNAGVSIADYNQDGNLDLISMGVEYLPTTTDTDGESSTSWKNMTVHTSMQLAYGSGTGVGYKAQSSLSFQDYSGTNINIYFTANGNSAPTFPIPFGLCATDISGDGIPDLVLSGYTSTQQPAVFMLIQSTPGVFTASDTVLIPNGKSFSIQSDTGANNTSTPGSTILSSQISSVDLNCDGYEDLATVDPNYGQLLLLTSSLQPLANSQTQSTLDLAGGALPQFAIADYNLDGYSDMITPGENNGTSQSAPVLVLNGTINTGTFSYTPSNGQALTGQNFTDIYFGGSDVSTISATSTSYSSNQNSSVIQAASAPNNVTITGQVFVDKNQNGRKNLNENALSVIRLFLDKNNNNQFDAGLDDTTTTDDAGYYTFNNVNSGRDYNLGFIDLPQAYIASSVPILLSGDSETRLVRRSIPVGQRWVLGDTVTHQIDPLIPSVIDIAPVEFRQSLGITPVYKLVGEVPYGLKINTYTGQINWTAPFSSSGKTIMLNILVQPEDNHNALLSQLNQVEIHVNTLSSASVYVRNVFGTLLHRQPTEVELNEWAAKLQNNVSEIAFVSKLAHTDERYEILTKAVYLNLLSRQPTAEEYASAIVVFQAGGNSDQLTKQVLTSSEFYQKYASNQQYLYAVNQALLFKQPAAGIAAWESRWLGLGGSRIALVNWIFKSQTATMARAKQLAGLADYPNATNGMIKSWASALAKGALNSDTLFVRLLASGPYVQTTMQATTPSMNSLNSNGNSAYNRLSHLQFSLTGSDPMRAGLDQLEKQLYQGQTWTSVASGIYDSDSAIVHRIQIQYQNLLHRRANDSEIENLTHSLPANNLTEALQTEILSGAEYQSQFKSNSDYIASAYKILTGHTASDSVVRGWAVRLDNGQSALQLIRNISNSTAGRIGQIDRAYADYLLRDPSQFEVNQWLSRFSKTTPNDKAIALKLVNSTEFRQHERPANLLPVT